MRLIGKTERAHGIVDETNFVLPALTQPMLGKDDKVPIRAYRVTFGEGGGSALSYPIAYDDAGVYTIQYTASDSAATPNTTILTIAVTVTADTTPPSISANIDGQTHVAAPSIY